MHLFTISILTSFGLWPMLLFAALHVTQPSDNTDWLPSAMHSFVGAALSIVLLNIPAFIPIVWSLLACFFAGWLSSLKFKSGYFIALLVLPAAWLCDCYPGPPR
jgi:hypothetical protein